MEENSVLPSSHTEADQRQVVIKVDMAEDPMEAQACLNLWITCSFTCTISLHQTDLRGQGKQSINLWAPTKQNFQWETVCNIDEILTLYVEIPPSDNPKGSGPYDRCFLQFAPQEASEYHQ